MPIHNHYRMMEEENEQLKKHVDNMYGLINQYAKENNIQLAYNDIAERFVESIATYIVESKEDGQNSKEMSRG